MKETHVSQTTPGMTLGDESRDPVHIHPGDRIGRYLVLQRLGSGGMGVVYAAYDAELDRKVAIKVLRTGKSERATSAGRTRLLREAQALARLTHPNVVTVHDVGLHDGFVFVAMEYVDGDTLDAWLARKRNAGVTWREIVEVLVAAGQGLAAAHAAGLIHRDVKPENVMIDRAGRVLVMDFGLARASSGNSRLSDPDSASDLSDAASDPSGVSDTDAMRPSSNALSNDLTRAGALVGTPNYMAPEQHLSLPTDERTDQFNYCVTAYEALYGSRPFAGDTMAELSLSVTSGKVRPAPPKTDVPASIRRALLRGLSVDPTDRWPDMAGLIEALRVDPFKRRRRLLAGGVFAAAIAGVLGFVQVDHAHRVAMCERSDDVVDQVWDDAKATAIHEALSRTGVAYADLTFERLDGRMRDYIASWSAARREACRLHHVERRRDAELHERAVACLDARRHRLEALTELLLDADEGLATQGVFAAAALPTVEACRDDAHIAEQVPLPAGPAEREAVTRLRERLAKALAAYSAGRYEAAHAAALAMRPAAEATEYAPILAEVDYVLGASERKLGRYERAEKRLTATYLDAGVAGHDLVAAQAAIELAFTVGYFQNRPREGLAWADLGRMLAERGGVLDPRIEGGIWSAKGVLLDISGDADGAINAHERARDLYASVLDPEHPDMAQPELNLGNALYAKDDGEGALEHFEKATAIQRSALGETHPRVADGVNNIGAVHLAYGHHAKAARAFEEALKIREKALGPDHALVGEASLNLGHAHKLQGDLEGARKNYERALAIFEKRLGPDHPNVAATLDDIGALLDLEENFEAAIGFHERAIAVWNASPTDHANDVAQAREAIAHAKDQLAVAEAPNPPD